MSHYTDKYNRSLKKGTTTHTNVKEYQEKSQKIRREKEAFLNREFDYRDYIFAPEGYEGVMLFLYIMIIPYVIGLAFLFLFIAKSSYHLFLEFNLASFMIIWAIGYEICAVLAIIIFFYSWMKEKDTVEIPKGKKGKKRRVAPRFRN